VSTLENMFFFARAYGRARHQARRLRLILGLIEGCRVRFKPWAVAAARGRRDLSTFTTLQVMKTNSDTTAKPYTGFDVHKEKNAIALAEPGASGERHGRS
jgi:hypothetical protein